MESSTGRYFVGLDHVRAVAAFLVFTWHFNHVNDGHLAAAPVFPLSIFTEGHVGVALFMTLSGYLFAKLIGQNQIHTLRFLANRIIRLFPLLFVAFALTFFLQVMPSGQPIGTYLQILLRGFVTPEWPNGGWSITVELHFYLMLPLLLMIRTRNPIGLLVVIALSITLRAALWVVKGEVQSLAYWTLVGCIDQFVFGMLAFYFSHRLRRRHFLAVGTGLTLLVFMYLFDVWGGFYMNETYPTPSPIWIVAPTISGLCFATLIAWYDTSFRFESHFFSNALALVGTCSYSIYLLHFFVVFDLAQFVQKHVVDLTHTPTMVLASAICFVGFVPVAWASYRFFERPPMRFRQPYIQHGQS